jgi:release factor glutamine methyltransferase
MTPAPPPQMTSRTWTTLELLKTTAEFLAARGLPAARLAAERLLAHAKGCKRVELYLATDKLVEERVLEVYRGLVREYASGAPLQYVVGEAEFMGLPLAVDRRALIPRPETELLVDAVVKRLRRTAGPPPAVLELGTGSGAIAVALAVHLPQAEVWTTEVSSAAAALAIANVRRHGVSARVQVLVMDRFEGLSPELEGAMTCVVSNPPYVSTAEMAQLPAVVREHEPQAALHGGADGLDFHRYLCTRGVRFLSAGGTLAVEIGAGQGAAAQALYRDAGLHDVTMLQDYAGHDRIVLGTK